VYGKKVRKLESAEYLATHKPALELNIGAANRFISHAIPDLSADQKTALKEVMRLDCLVFQQCQLSSFKPTTLNSACDELCMCCLKSNRHRSCRSVRKGNRQTKALGPLQRWLGHSLNRRLGVLRQKNQSEKSLLLSDK
jgi:hypothetical protein